MNTTRIEAFSDAVLAVIITIMVLELKAPAGSDLAALRPLLPSLLIYILSFQVVGSYWNNHHHLLRVARQVDSRIMWTNLHLLFWLSLVPFFTAWLGQHYRAAWPTALYGSLLLICATAYQYLQRAIMAGQPEVAKRIGQNLKGKLSLAFYAAAVPLAFVSHWFSDLLFVLVAITWAIPDHRLERTAIANPSQNS